MHQYGDYLMRMAFLLLKDRQAAEEAVQDTFIQAFNKIGQLQDPVKLKGWLIQIAINRCRMKQRTWSWKHLFPFARMEQVEVGREPGPEEIILTEWRNERLGDAVHSLDYKYREVITLFYYNEMSVKEIAGYLQCNENTVKARLARGRLQLKRIIEGGEGYEDGSRAGLF
ncbi:sigma-70 family RNA polymerase sigma factor [Paenibacillus sp. sptzw28]|uniref:sigma-70 family RNA polymerase sigma factor n=1 Tax=Paenibacillus sp. sptzw28 TaxID=715179 RepID=UPI001C6EE217|nr:sigma-70 family RNA polymerase sigma factor [Paenibacillus sp. sptzw28]